LEDPPLEDVALADEFLVNFFVAILPQLYSGILYLYHYYKRRKRFVMLKLRKAEERGETRTDWLHGKHSFSFGHYYNEEHTGFGDLVVINDDIIAPAGGFAEHGHKDMEIVTYVIEGELAHKDSMGNVATIKAGEVQRMSAGRAVRHSEFNASDKDRVRLLQIWFLPKYKGDKPSYEQKYFSADDKRNKLKLMVSEGKKDGSIDIGQDIDIYAGIFDKDIEIIHDTKGRNIWLQVARGDMIVNGTALKEGDGLAVTDEKELQIKAINGESEFLIFSMER